MTDQQPSAEAKPSPPPTSRVLDSRELFSDQNTVLIRHENQYYRLLKTKNGKLLLQK